jgi:hypothetical protein
MADGKERLEFADIRSVERIRLVEFGLFLQSGLADCVDESD